MARGMDWHSNIFSRIKRQGVCHITSILQEKFSVSLLKMILCIEVAERFANPRARAQQGLTDKVKTKKERKKEKKCTTEQSRRKQNSTVCSHSIQRQLFPTYETQYRQYQGSSDHLSNFYIQDRLQDYPRNDPYRIEPQSCIGLLLFKIIKTRTDHEKLQKDCVRLIK